MDFSDYLSKTTEVQRNFKEQLKLILNTVDFLDPIIGENIIAAFIDNLINEIEQKGPQDAYVCFSDNRYDYLFNRMNDENQVGVLIDTAIVDYLDARTLLERAQ